MFSFVFDSTFLTIFLPILAFWYVALCFKNANTPGIFGIIFILAIVISLAGWYHIHLIEWFSGLNWILIFWTYVLYFIMGAIFAIVKWWLYVRKAVRDIRAYLSEHLNEIPAQAALTLGYGVHVPIRVSDNKDKIYVWIEYWSFYLVHSIIGDFFINIVKNIYNMITNVMQNISNSAFRGL